MLLFSLVRQRAVRCWPFSAAEVLLDHLLHLLLLLSLAPAEIAARPREYSEEFIVD